tara:strand:- start:63 stop:578 length:516 start_codon:yes stop_codon:yes gene_type:complete
MRLLQISLLFLTLNTFAQAQDTISQQEFERRYFLDTTYNQETAFCAVIGYNVWAYHFAELGFAIAHSEVQGMQTVGTNIYLTTEIKLDNQLMIGPKIGIWSGTGLGGLGINMTYFTDLEEGALCIKPEMGFGLSRFKLSYGYNFNLTNKEFKRFNSHVIGLNVSLDLFKLK